MRFHHLAFAIILAIASYGIQASLAFAEEGHDHNKERSNDEEHADEHEHGHHEEGSTEITDHAAQEAGVELSKAGPVVINETLTLTGRIMLNRNKTAEVRARFPGVVQKVNVNWGDHVKKGDVLATIEANESLRVYSLSAPMDGVVLTRNTNIGNVASDGVLFTISDLSQVWAEFHVFPRDLDIVKEEQLVDVHSLEKDKEVEAPISLILPTADPLSQTVVAVVPIPNGEGKWRPGMTVEGDVHISKKAVLVGVTEDAVQRMDDKTVVFVKQGDDYKMRPVELGSRDGHFVEIRKGLKPNEMYVSKGSFIVKADIGKSEAAHEH